MTCPRNPLRCALAACRARAARLALACLPLPLALAAGCVQEMAVQPRYDPLEPSEFFADGMSARPLEHGTVPRGGLRLDPHLFEGFENGELAGTLPEQFLPLQRETLRRGQERYEIYCAICHDRAGTGRGMVVQRGFPQPPSLHEPELLEAPLGHLFRVASYGIRRMPAHERQIPVEDRWAIAAYVRTLQLSQNLPLEDAPDDVRDALRPEAP